MSDFRKPREEKFNSFLPIIQSQLKNNSAGDVLPYLGFELVCDQLPAQQMRKQGNA